MRTDSGEAVGKKIENSQADLHIPALCDVEVVSALRKIMAINQLISEKRAKQAISDLLDLPLVRHTHEGLLEKAFELRNNLSIYDAVYVALAQALGAKLITADKALTKAPVPNLNIEIIAI